ncbi:MAG: diguanylate cyclase, partial [Desulfobacteraceae bacterium]|nr:diguanylate cyclase [Desulfobacteraceae bacterium]
MSLGSKTKRAAFQTGKDRIGHMFAFLRNLNIKTKLQVGFTLILVFAILAGGTIIYNKVRATIEENIESELTNTMATILNMIKTAADASIRNQLRVIAESNRQVVESIYAEYLNGLITEDEAKAAASKIIISQRIGKSGYLYCVKSNGVAPVHPKPGTVGRIWLSEAFVRDQIRKKDGYIEYDWKNPREDTVRPKALYMSYFKPWDWIISASSYRDEFHELVNISDFKESILALKFGESGYAYVLDMQGNLIVHPSLSGNFYDTTDDSGLFFVRDILNKKNGTIVYSWKNPGETAFRDKIVRFSHIPEFGWIVACSSYLDEMYAP